MLAHILCTKRLKYKKNVTNVYAKEKVDSKQRRRRSTELKKLRAL